MKCPKGRLSMTGLRCPTSLLSTMGLGDITCLCGRGLLSATVGGWGATAFSPRCRLSTMGLLSTWPLPLDACIPKGLAVLLTTEGGLASVRWTSLYALVGVVAAACPHMSGSDASLKALGCASMSRELDRKSGPWGPELEMGVTSREKVLVVVSGVDTLSMSNVLNITSSPACAGDCPSGPGALGSWESGTEPLEGNGPLEAFCGVLAGGKLCGLEVATGF